jgi:hypothetical protein
LNEIIGVMAAFGHHLDSISQKDHLTDALSEVVAKLKPLRSPDEICIVMREIRHYLSNLIIYTKGLNDKIKLDHARSNSPPQRDQFRQPLKLYSSNEGSEYDEASLKQLYSMQTSNENMKLLIDQLHLERERSFSLK